MRSLRGGSIGFEFNAEEIEKVNEISNDLVSQIKGQNLAYAQAIEVLEQCKIKLQMSLLK